MSVDADEKQVKYLTAQVDPEYFKLVRIQLIRKNLTMRDAIVQGLNLLLGIKEVNEDDLSTRSSLPSNEAKQSKERK